MKDYNQIMETLERELIGRNVRVTIDGDGCDELTYQTKFEDAWYEVERIKARSKFKDIVGDKPLREGVIKSKRVEADTDEMRSDVESINLMFSNGRLVLSGCGLELGTVYNWALPNPSQSGVYALSSGLDRGLIVKLEERK